MGTPRSEATLGLDWAKSRLPEAYWVAGCSSCLRMKEFLESSGIPFKSINIGLDPGSAVRLREMGGEVPAVLLEDRWASGMDLNAVARLLGIDYQSPTVLPSAELAARYGKVVETLCRLISQADERTLLYRRAERDRTLLNLAYHAASVMRTFLMAYDPDGYEGEPYVITIDSPVPSHVTDAGGVIARARQTQGLFNSWWDRDGRDDSLDQVVETYWGHRTALEALEREVWHTAQHTRQVALFIEECGIIPDRPLGPDELDGLPLPERVFA